MNPFVAWNLTLLRQFFFPGHEGERVFLAVARDELDDIGPDLGGYDGLIQAVREGPPWGFTMSRCSNSTDVLELERLAESLMVQRTWPQTRPRGYVSPNMYTEYGDDKMPTYLPILAALVGISTEYEHGAGGFYLHAQRALGLSSDWGSAELRQVNHLWDDLARWTGPDETNGVFGKFKASVLGGYVHLGEIRAQGMFRSSDAERLGGVFADCGLSPGQNLGQEGARAVIEKIAVEQTLSGTLQTAARREEYRDVLHERIQQILDDWDGSVPERVRTSARTDETDPDRAPLQKRLIDPDVGVSLHLTEGSLPWRLGWTVEAKVDDGSGTIRWRDNSWTVTFDGELSALAAPARASQPQTALNAAMVSERGSIQLELELEGPRLTKELSQTLRYRHRPLTYFVADRGCLVESETLPAYGSAYLLVAPDNTHFDRLMEVNEVDCQEYANEGLPSGWRLLGIADCAALKSSQRAIMPDGRSARARPRVVRLVGGVRIRRGGRTQFLPYDLPSVEVDAPVGSEIRAPGLRLDRVTSSPRRTLVTSGTTPQLGTASRLRFRMEVEETDRQRFDIEVWSDGARLGSAVLRVAMNEIPLGSSPTIGLSSWGGTITGDSALVGMNAPGESIHPVRPIDLTSLDAGLREKRGWSQQLTSVAEAKFLDSVACGQAQAVPYGTCRHRLRRYLDESGRGSPIRETLRSLRRRGLLEVATDGRGRWAAVAPVPPTLYRLPVTVESQPVWGVAGTLSYAHWESLDEAASDVRFGSATSALPAPRIVGEHGNPEGFEVLDCVCITIAEFSASLEELEHELSTRIGYDTLDTRAGPAAWYNPLQATWGNGGPPPYRWLLQRYADPDTGAHLLHSLRHLDGENRRGYRPIRDERWGKWLTYDASIRWLEASFPGQQGLAPWPLEYDALEQRLWLPARMNLPYVLERALVAASGASPHEVVLERRSGSEGVVGVIGDEEVGPFSLQYHDLLPPTYQRVWLRFDLVPPELVKKIAAKLGCRIHDISRRPT